MRIALATCENLPGWEVDDRPLHAALRARGVELAQPVWSDQRVDWSGFDACLIRTTWDYQERRDEFLAWADRCATATRLFNPADVVHWNTHKSYLRDLAARGVPIAPTVWLPPHAPVDLAAVLATRGWSRAFLKPAVGATASDTLRFDVASPTELDAAQAHAARLVARDEALLQPYLARVERAGERSAIFIDGAISHTVRKIPVAGDYRVQDDFGARDEPVAFSAAERALAERVMHAAGAGTLLYGRVDFLEDDAGAPVVTELELVEPSLFLRHEPRAASRLADALCDRVAREA